MSRLILTLAICFSSFSGNALKKSQSKTKVAKLNLASPSLYYSWAMSAKTTKGHINLPKKSEMPVKKKDVIIAIVDTGVDFNHPLLKDSLVTIKNLDPKNINKINYDQFVPQIVPATKSSYGLDFSKKNPTTTPNDTHGHGSHIAGIIKKVMPEAKFLILKYYGAHLSGKESLAATIKALMAAVASKVDIINYSGGGPHPSFQERLVLKQAEKNNITVVAAAGNESSNIDQKQYAYFPASYNFSNIISVAAHNRNGTKIAASNWGKRSVHVSAPGLSIMSSIPTRFSLSKIVPIKSEMTGTSQATAFVTGAIGLLLSRYPTLSPVAMKNIIMKSSRKVSLSKYAKVNKKLKKVTVNPQETISQSRGLLDIKNIFKVLSNEKKSFVKRAIAVGI